MVFNIPHNHTAIAVMGILGNIISGLVYLAPLPTFRRIYQRKSTEGFQSVPYVVALFSAMLWLYYGLLKKKDLYLISINSVGCIIQTLYIAVYYAYAPENARYFTAKLVVSLNLTVFSAIVIIIQLAMGKTSSSRVRVLGIICAFVTAGVFVSPLGILVKVIRTRSVEFMPFLLSFFLTLCAAVWFLYGLFSGDLYVSIPNVIGIILGLLQMVLYVVFKHCFFSNESKNLGNLNMVPENFAVVVNHHQAESEQQGNNERAD